MWIEYENEFFNLDNISNIRKLDGDTIGLILMSSGKEIKKITFETEFDRQNFLDSMLEIETSPSNIKKIKKINK